MGSGVVVIVLTSKPYVLLECLCIVIYTKINT